MNSDFEEFIRQDLVGLFTSLISKDLNNKGHFLLLLNYILVLLTTLGRWKSWNLLDIDNINIFDATIVNFKEEILDGDKDYLDEQILLPIKNKIQLVENAYLFASKRALQDSSRSKMFESQINTGELASTSNTLLVKISLENNFFFDSRTEEQNIISFFNASKNNLSEETINRLMKIIKEKLERESIKFRIMNLLFDFFLNQTNDFKFIYNPKKDFENFTNDIFLDNRFLIYNDDSQVIAFFEFDVVLDFSAKQKLSKYYKLITEIIRYWLENGLIQKLNNSLIKKNALDILFIYGYHEMHIIDTSFRPLLNTVDRLITDGFRKRYSLRVGDIKMASSIVNTLKYYSEISKIDRGLSFVESKIPIDLFETLNEIVDMFNNWSKTKSLKIKLHLQIQEEVMSWMLRTNSKLLIICIESLIRNSILHKPSDVIDPLDILVLLKKVSEEEFEINIYDKNIIDEYYEMGWGIYFTRKSENLNKMTLEEFRDNNSDNPNYRNRLTLRVRSFNEEE